MLDQGNRTFIGSVVFVDIIGYSKRTVSEQIDLKDRFTSLLSAALGEIPQEQRLILDTGDGAALSFLGDPEDALFVSMNMRDMVGRASLAAAAEGVNGNDPALNAAADLPLRIGINLGPVKLVRDINGHPNIVGDGINVAQRIMSFANVGQIVVSRSFYDVVSVISDEYGKLFKYEGSRTDKHVREHEIYVVGESAAAFDKAKAGTVDRAANTNPHMRPGGHGIQTGTYGFNQALLPDENLPFLQNRRKQAVAGGALAAVVLALALTLVFKRSAPPPPEPVASPTPVEAKAASPATAPAPTPKVEGAGSAAPADAGVPMTDPANPNAVATTGASPAGAPVAAGALPVAAPATVPIDDKAAAKAAAAKAESAKGAIVLSAVNFDVKPWGEVLVNGKAIGVSPPLKQHKLAPGKYKIEIKNTTFTPHITTIEVKAKEDVSIKHTFR